MITAVDSSVLFDVLLDDPLFESPSEEMLSRVSGEGTLVICEAVYAEVAGHFLKKSDLDIFLQETGVQLSPSTPETLSKAGHLWRQADLKRSHRASPARRLLADFLIGAHGLLQAERLLTRDKGFYRSAFSGLRLA